MQLQMPFLLLCSDIMHVCASVTKQHNKICRFCQEVNTYTHMALLD